MVVEGNHKWQRRKGQLPTLPEIATDYSGPEQEGAAVTILRGKKKGVLACG